MVLTGRKLKFKEKGKGGPLLQSVFFQETSWSTLLLPWVDDTFCSLRNDEHGTSAWLLTKGKSCICSDFINSIP